MTVLRRFWPVALALSVGAAAQPSIQVRDHPDQVAIAFEQAPIDHLESIYLRCAREAELRLLSVGEAALCSTASETLLKRRFGGDFDAMLSWWRQAKKN